MNLTPTFYISKIKTSTRARVKATCGKSKQKPTEKTKRRLEGQLRGRRTRRHGGRAERRPKPRRLRRWGMPGGRKPARAAEAVVPRACGRGARTTRTGGAHPPTASDPGAALELRIGRRDWSGKWPDGGHGDGDGQPAGWGP